MSTSNPPSQTHEPLGTICTVAPLSRRHLRAGFSCGVEQFDKPLQDHHVDGPRSDRAVIVATMPSSDEVLGYGCIEMSDIQIEGMPGTCLYVPWLAVDKKVQRRGIGRRIMSELMMLGAIWAQRERISALSLHADSGVREFYKKFGFTLIGDRLCILSADAFVV